MILHYPQTKEAQAELAKRVAQVHAQIAVEQIKALPCSAPQKAALLDAVIQLYKARTGNAIK